MKVRLGTLVGVLGTLCQAPLVHAQVEVGTGALAQYSTVMPSYVAVGRTIGLAPLADAKLAEGWREIRLWVTGPGPVLKSRVIRVVQSPDSVFGEVYQWWSGLWPDEEVGACLSGRDGSLIVSVPGSEPVAAQITVCQLRAPEVDWAGTLRFLDGLGVGTLASWQQMRWGPEGLTVDKGADGTGIKGESLDGERYHAFYWWGADLDDGPAAAAANEMVEWVFEVERAALARTR